MPLEGTQLGHYRLVQQVGGGGMSEVYLAEDMNLPGRKVAIKVVRAEMASYPHDDVDRDSGRLFQREARVITMLDHPHILPLYDFGEGAALGVTLTYIVMPYRPDGSLANWLRQRRTNQPLSPQQVVQLISQAAEALQYAHNQAVVHRDVKPTNFLIQRNTTDSSIPYLQLADFGIAKMSTGTSSMSQHVRGTPTYMAPEQWRGITVPATDQYALAVMAYELLTGRPPFEGELMRLLHQHINEKPRPPSTLNPACNRDIDTIILHALEKDPQNRFRSVTAFANALKQAANVGTDVLIPPPPPSGKIQPTPVPRNTSDMDPRKFYPTPRGTAENSFHSSTTSPEPFTPMQRPGPMTPLPPPALAPSKQPWYRSRTMVIALVGLALLIILSGIAFAATTVITNTNNANATATANTGTSTAIANASTATAIANATAHAQATANVIAANPDPYDPKTGKIALLDSLNGSNGNWNTKPGCSFISGAYHANATANGAFFPCYLTQPSFSNFALQVDMKIIKGDCGGISFRANSNSGQQYIFRVCQDNDHYYLYRCTSDNTNCPVLKSDLTFDINDGLGASNTIAVVANGTNIDLYINGTKVNSATDTAYSSGQIGLIASTINNRTEVVYTNLKLWVL